jgi:hypothetical protein
MPEVAQLPQRSLEPGLAEIEAIVAEAAPGCTQPQAVMRERPPPRPHQPLARARVAGLDRFFTFAAELPPASTAH